MSLLGSSDLAFMRAQVASMLPDTAIIKSVTNAVNEAGQWAETWTPVSAGTVACRVDPMTKQMLAGAIAGQEAMTVRYQFTTTYDAPLAVGYRVTTGSHDYEVVQIDQDHSWRVSRRAILADIRS